ncbi:hypothetical protein S7711_11049 [Stachybotrys chartarum IBT 7711]|uniref:Uncharacterized protein n=1 Tax=Stachybotrys chartarum (strain CBS 109288 / IBT 7711) TaxID=1280523 RepID=A0A084B2J9_STACB|nr:hypothetical protein S7711_11049 [Stachybotrys chartarum IBT 7711]
MTRDRPINPDVIRTLKEHLGKLDILLTYNLRTAYLALEENSQRLRELLILEAQPGNIANDFQDPYNKSSGNPAEKLEREKPMSQALEPSKQDPSSSVSNSEEAYMHIKPENDSLRSPSPESSMANGTGDIREDDTNNAVESNSRAGTMDDGGPKHISTMEINKPQARRLMKPIGGQIDGLQSVGYEYDPNSLSASVRIRTPWQLVGFAEKLKEFQLRMATMAKAHSGNSLFHTITIDLNGTRMHAFPKEVVQVLQDVTERLVKEQILTQDSVMDGIDLLIQIAYFFLWSVEPATTICQLQNALPSRPQPQ